MGKRYPVDAPRGIFAPMPVGQFYATTSDVMAWVWEDYLPVGSLSALIAYPKAGKSTFAYALVPSVAHGQPFLGRPAKSGGVLVLAVEEDPGAVKRRLTGYGVTPDDPVYVQASVFPLSPRAMADVAQFIERHEVTLVIVDTIAHLWNVLDENNTMQVLRALTPWLELARTSGAAVLLVHHAGKTEQPGARAPRGASSFGGVVDQVLTLKPHRVANRRVLDSVGRYAETPRRLIVELADGEYVLAGSGDDPTMGDRLLACVRGWPRELWSSSALAQAIGVDPPTSTFYKALEMLKADGSLVSPEKGWWGLPGAEGARA